MAGFYSWLWRLMVANPLAVRIVHGGGRQKSHAWIRMLYLGILSAMVGLGLLWGTGLKASGLGELAKVGTTVFVVVSYGQVLLICFLSPLFMAGAIAQEQSGQTYEILLTTPLSNLQIVLGSLLGRLYFILSLLLSGLPLFAVLVVVGGVAVQGIFVAFGVAALTAMLCGAVAVTVSVSRWGGRKAVYVFVVVIGAYLAGGYGLDQVLRLVPTMAATGGGTGVGGSGVGGTGVGGTGVGGTGVGGTTWLTAVHPLLVLESVLNAANYRTPGWEEWADRAWVVRMYWCRPVWTFAVLSSLLSLGLVLWSTIGLRSMVERGGRMMGGAGEAGVEGAKSGRRGRTVWRNPVAWQEAAALNRHRWGKVGRWVFAGGMWVVTLCLLGIYHGGRVDPLTGQVMDAKGFYAWITVLLWMQVLVVVLMGVYLSAGAVSREREDGTLDILLTTPIGAKEYLWGKWRGVVSYLVLPLLVPVVTVGMLGLYTVVGKWMGWRGAMPVMMMTQGSQTVSVARELVLPEMVVWGGLMWSGFAGLCVATGMWWSLKARSVLGAVVPTLGVVVLVVLGMGFCGNEMVGKVPVLGPVVNSWSLVTGVWMLLEPWEVVSGFADNSGVGRVIMGVGVAGGAGMYGLVIYTLIQTMIRSFDQMVRRLAGTTN